MKITKFGHSCLFIEEGDARILIDPGVFSFEDMTTDAIPSCNIILITHAHGDHADPERIAAIVARDKPFVLTNAGVQTALAEHDVESTVIARGETRTEHGITMRGIACDHAFIGDWGNPGENIGFVIAKRLFHPGDCISPSEAVQTEILAAPIVAPWMAVHEAVDFIRRQKPTVVIPIHDGIVGHHHALWYRITNAGIASVGLQLRTSKIGEAIEL
jgi:L-ascorbate metabolism protein UlaG (beta-lactamase superfamily)